MAKKSEHKLRKHTLNLFAGDYEILQDLHPETGAGAVVRQLIRGHISRIEAAQEQKATGQLTLNTGDL